MKKFTVSYCDVLKKKKITGGIGSAIKNSKAIDLYSRILCGKILPNVPVS